MLIGMEATCACGAAARGPARHVLDHMRNHNCPNSEEVELETETEVRVGFQPNPPESEDDED